MFLDTYIYLNQENKVRKAITVTNLWVCNLFHIAIDIAPRAIVWEFVPWDFGVVKDGIADVFTIRTPPMGHIST